MDEQLIGEVQNHAVIYNRQKYFLNNARSGKYENKEDAWIEISAKIGTDVDTCKKRWKYLRERYVQQRKQGDPPTYEHLSRPYLEKMKFLDQHIQPRKSYRNVSNYLSSPNGGNPFNTDYMDSSHSNDGSIKHLMCQNFHEGDIKLEPDQLTTSQQTNTSQIINIREQQQSSNKKHHLSNSNNNLNNNINNLQNNSINQMPSSQTNDNYRDNENYQVPSSSSSLKSPLSTPPTIDLSNDTTPTIENIKRPRLDINHHYQNNNHHHNHNNNNNHHHRSNEDSSETDELKLRYNSLYNNKIDERLIAEVQNHSVIYNRQKYLLTNGGKQENRYESKEDAWTKIAIKIGMDMDGCKKRWKYLRERYVQQRKQGDTPTYEHLSRPYLEKMKFLDQHIQPRKSYRNVSSFLSSPNGCNPFNTDYMDSSRSNGSINNLMCQNFQEGDIKLEPYQSFQTFQSSVNHHNNSHSSSSSLPLLQQQGIHNNNITNNHNQIKEQQTPSVPLLNHLINTVNDYRENELYGSGGGGVGNNSNINIIPSSSSSLKSPLSSSTPPTTGTPGGGSGVEHLDPIEIIKRPLIELIHSSSSSSEDDDDDEDDNDELDHGHNQQNNNEHHNAVGSGGGGGGVPAPAIYPADFLFSMYQKNNSHHRHMRSSEYLLGELVTSELLKMNRERRKLVQKRILEILFFDE